MVSSRLDDPGHVHGRSILVLDASVVVNLVGSGQAGLLLRAVGRSAIVEETTLREVTRDPFTRRSAEETLRPLFEEGLLALGRLSDRALDTFMALVSAPEPDDLDDGEAAAIAHAQDIEAAVVVDERKAVRILTEHFPDVPVVQSVDLFSARSVVGALGKTVLANLVFATLVHARMHVPRAYREWVVELIGPDRASQCPSLPKRRR